MFSQFIHLDFDIFFNFYNDFLENVLEKSTTNNNLVLIKGEIAKVFNHYPSKNIKKLNYKHNQVSVLISAQQGHEKM